MNEKLECEINTNLLHSWTVGLVVPYILSTACVCANTPLLFELTNECFFLFVFVFMLTAYKRVKELKETDE